MAEEKSFRDRPINMDDSGKRKWVYAKKPNGKWYNYRTYLSWFMLLFLIIAPIIKIGGHEFMLLDVANRKFVIFGVIFWAQDTVILALLMLSFVLFVVLFTVTFGRLWCGWACPQTIFLEMVFRKIEHFIEGDAAKRRALDKAPWTTNKIIKKTVKHIIFILISMSMTLAFLQWFTGFDKLVAILKEPIKMHLTGYFIFSIISVFFYWVYAWFREQICTMVCPYGRMQSVLLDSKSIIVAYDYNRGEPRGTKNEGDCVNCQQCVNVCPTGIDIRNGTQLECINCTACIDACDQTMERVKKPKGLIRFDSIEGIENKSKTIWNKRNLSYSAVLVVLFGFFVYTLFTRPNVETVITRSQGSLFQEDKKAGTISNIYNIKIINKTHQDIPLSIKIENIKGNLQISNPNTLLKNHGQFESIMMFTVDKSAVNKKKTYIEFGIYKGDELLETKEVTFLAPTK